MKRLNIAVTGGSGRVGRHVVAELERHGHRGSVLDLTAPPFETGFGHDRVDVLEIASLRQALAGRDAVIHLAGLDSDFGFRSEEYIRTNVLGSWHVLQAAQEVGVPRVVLCSSIAACGLHEARPDHPPRYLPVDEQHGNRPVHPYGVSKLLIETMAARAADGGRTTVICLRPMLVLLPEVIPSLVQRAKDQSVRWLFYYVTAEDMAQAFRKSVEADEVEFGVFFVSAADSCTVEPTLDLVGRLWPDGVEVRDKRRYEVNERASVFDSGAAQRVLGFSPTSNWQDIVAKATSAA